MRSKHVVTEAQRAIFLRALARCETVTEAANYGGTTRAVFQRLRREDSAFADAWDKAFLAGADVMLKRRSNPCRRRNGKRFVALLRARGVEALLANKSSE
jgi:hypothetical protein